MTEKEFKKGAALLVRHAKANGYKINMLGLQTFLANADLDAETASYYQMCIPQALDLV